jgi:hypothetical protein
MVQRYDPEAGPASGPRLSPDFLAGVNDRLDLPDAFGTLPTPHGGQN